MKACIKFRIKDRVNVKEVDINNQQCHFLTMDGKTLLRPCLNSYVFFKNAYISMRFALLFTQKHVKTMFLLSANQNA